MNDNDIEGEEDGISGMDGEVKVTINSRSILCVPWLISFQCIFIQVTPFNMREELEEGHFDADGHFQWNKDNEIKDNWLDNLDWVKVYKKPSYILTFPLYTKKCIGDLFILKKTF